MLRRRTPPLTRKAFRYAPLLAIGTCAAALLSAAYNPAAAKLVYSCLTLAALIGIASWSILNAMRRRGTRPHALAQFAVCGTLTLWLLFGESNWYVIPMTEMGVPHTQPYLAVLPAWWWLLCGVLPAIGIAWLAGAREEAWTQTSALDYFDRPARRALFQAAIVLILLTGLLQAWEFSRPRMGLQVLEGDEYGYLIIAYHLLEYGMFNPPHMPVISLYLAMILALAGDSVTAILVGNIILYMLTIGLLLYALWLISSDLRVVILGGLLLVSLRALTVYLWTPLTETLNTFLWTTALVCLLVTIRRATIVSHAAFGLVIAVLLLTRSQNIGGILGIAIVYVIAIVGVKANRNAVSARQVVMGLIALLITATVPLVAWGEYRKAVTGKFQVMDGRGADILLGMNMPGLNRGNGANVWEPNVTSWKAAHPNASQAQMALAAVRYRAERPIETLGYIWYRGLELFNFRFPLFALNTSYWVAAKANIQLTIAVLAALLLFFTPFRWLAVAIFAILIPFLGIFLAIHTEPRYRIPMDPLLTVGATIMFAHLLFKGRAIVPLRQTFPLRSVLSATPSFAVLLAFCVLIIGGMRIINDSVFVNGRPQFVGAEMRPEGAILVQGPPVDLATYQDIPTWEDLIQTDDPRNLEGKTFRGRFGLIGHLFRAGNLDKYARVGIQHEELIRAESTGKAPGKHLVLDRLSFSFKGAKVEAGIKQRGVMELVGRVRSVKLFQDVDARDFVFIFIDVLYANCSEEAKRQECKR